MRRRGEVRWFLAVLMLFAGTCVLPTATDAAVYYYDGSLVPDDPSLQETWSTLRMGTTWHVQDDELTMTTAEDRGIWFCNHPDYDPVRWQLADNDQGNYVEFVARLAADSGEWEAHCRDGTYSAGLKIYDGSVGLLTQTGVLNLPLGTRANHRYAFHFRDGVVTYWIDSKLTYTGPKTLNTYDNKLLYIGDGSGAPGTGYGSMIVDEAIVATHLPGLLPGDANLDGQVTDADYTLWADHYGQENANRLSGDFDGNGKVTDADYTIWADNYGTTAGVAPEPAVVGLLSLGALPLFRRRIGSPWALIETAHHGVVNPGPTVRQRGQNAE